MSADRGLIRILSVDDHHIVRQGIAGLVGGQADMNLVVEASNGREAIQRFRTNHPDIAMMDLQTQSGRTYSGKPTRRNRSWKRGSDRSGSRQGSTLRKVSPLSRTTTAFSSHSNAESFSPRPA